MSDLSSLGGDVKEVRKRILFFESSISGVVGGSHHCLLLIVKNLPEAKFHRIVVLNSDNALSRELEKHCDKLLIMSGPSASLFAEGYGREVREPVNNGKGTIASYIIAKMRTLRDGVRHDLLSGIGITLKYYRLLKQNHVDILHLNNWFDPYWNIAAKLRGVPIVQHCRGCTDSTYPPTCYWADRVICISDHVRKRVIKKGIDEEKTVRIYDAIDTSKFKCDISKERARSELNIKTDQIVVSIFGNVQRWKGQKTVIQACARLRRKYPAILCCIFGGVIEEDYAAELRELVRSESMEDHVLFAGYRSDVANCMNASDVIVHASMNPEPFGMVIIEGMTLSKPVIATNHGAPPEIIEDGVSGLLFEPGSDRQLSDQLDFLLSSPEEAKRLGNNAVRRVDENFDIRQNINAIQRVYEELPLKGRGEENLIKNCVGKT